MFVTEPEKQLSVCGDYDVVVCGGGVAGISAALAAARQGASVLLLEREFLLGGLATLGLITIYLPLCDGLGRQVSYGIAEELLRLSVKNGIEDQKCPQWLNSGSLSDRKKQRFKVRYNPHLFAIESELLLKSDGVKILYGTTACAVMKSDDRITHLIIENKSGRSAVAVKSVVDTTGDADICKLSGEETAQYEKGNSPAAWYYSVSSGRYRLNKLGFADIPDSERDSLAQESSQPHFCGTDADELSAFVELSHETILSDFLKCGKDTPEYALATVATVPQVRMTRRLSGLYTQDSCEMHKVYADSVGLFSDWRKAGPVYELPFSALYGAKVKNLITAGRCISVTDSMWDITRVIPVCAVSGQAAGTAAAMCDDFCRIDIAQLQNTLCSDGVYLHETELPLLSLH